MPQEMNVLCCYSCKMYQVHIVKKARKWKCKLCNAKQSVQQIYFQGSGQDCRLHVQHLNYLKANNTPLSFFPEQNDSSNTTITEESNINESVENYWSKYLNLPKKESQSVEEDLSSNDTYETEDMITNEKSLCNLVNNDSYNFDNIVDRSFEKEDITDETEKLSSMNFNYNPTVEDKCNLQDNSESNEDDNNVNIFETYSELDEPLDI
ncbi:hypothetical protein P5V15_000992 [Pogonomyrmex californicus]